MKQPPKHNIKTSTSILRASILSKQVPRKTSSSGFANNEITFNANDNKGKIGCLAAKEIIKVFEILELEID